MGVCVCCREGLPPSHQPGCLGPLGWVITTYLFCTPSCNRQRRSSGRWMRPSPCSRRCCDPPPNSNPQPPCSTNRDGSNKLFCQHLLSVCGVGRVWAGDVQRPDLGVPRSTRRAAGSCQALGPGGQRDASVWVCLWQSARPESCYSAASSQLPPSPAHLTALRPASTPAFGFRYILWPWVSPSGQGLPVLAPLLRASLSLYRGLVNYNSDLSAL